MSWTFSTIVSILFAWGTSSLLRPLWAHPESPNFPRRWGENSCSVVLICLKIWPQTMILRCVDSCIGAIGMLFESAGSWCWHHYGSFLCMMWQQFGTLQGLFRRLASQNSRLVLYINAVDPHLWTIYIGRIRTHCIVATAQNSATQKPLLCPHARPKSAPKRYMTLSNQPKATRSSSFPWYRFFFSFFCARGIQTFERFRTFE